MGEREILLTRKLVMTSAIDGKSRLLAAYFESLDNAGWLIELARTQARFQAWATMTHTTWAEFLGMGSHDLRRYRVTVARPNELREALVQLCRYVLTVEGEDVLTRIVKSSEYLKWSRALGLNVAKRLHSRGRKIEALATKDAVGQQLEMMRVMNRLTIKKWSHKIGTSENTYRARLNFNDVPEKWLADAKAAVKQQRDEALARGQAFVDVTDEELKKAIDCVWKSYLTRRDDIVSGRQQLSQTERVNLNLQNALELTSEEFEPSDEVPLEDL